MPKWRSDFQNLNNKPMLNQDTGLQDEFKVPFQTYLRSNLQI